MAPRERHIEVAKGFYYYELGIVEGDLFHVDTAKSHLEKALSLEPDHWHGKRLLNASQWWINEIQKNKKRKQ